MNKKILISLSVIATVAIIAIGGTIAYFSDVETSTGNTFTAGSLDLLVDSNCTYNDETQGFCTWLSKDLGEGDLFFNFLDVKPGDEGENTISLTVQNEAWVCARISDLVYADNSCTEPEGKAENAPDCDAEGELQDEMEFTIWWDKDCQNDIDTEDVVLVNDAEPVNGVWALYDSTTGAGAMPVGKTCLGVEWEVEEDAGNNIQTDSVIGNVSFKAVQARNNDGFKCVCVPQPGQLFADGFESNTFGAWAEHTGNWVIDQGGPSPSNYTSVTVGNTGVDDDILRAAAPTTGYQNIVLNYWYRTVLDLGGGDHVYVEWSIDGVNWNLVKDYTDGNYSEANGLIWVEETFNLNVPAGAANNPNFQFRLRSHLSATDDQMRFDKFVLTGDTICPEW